MKSWGVRLGMAGVTALLGILAIAQAQRDRLQGVDPLAQNSTPDVAIAKPIPSPDDSLATLWNAPPPAMPDMARGNGGSDTGIRQASHTEVSSGGASTISMPSTFGLTTPVPETPSAEPALPSVNPPAPSSLSLSLPPLSATAPATAEPIPALPPVPKISTPALETTELAPIGSGVAAPAASIPASPPSPLRPNALRDPAADAQATLPQEPLTATPSITAPAPSLSMPSIPVTPPAPSPSITPPVPSLEMPAPAMSPPAISPPAMSSSATSPPASRNMVATGAAGNFDLTKVNTEPQPGDARLEGAQTPSVLIHKKAPSEVKVGQPAVFVIQVRNTGAVTAYQVRVSDQVPRGMRLLDATPQPQVVQDQMSWNLGDVEPGGERAINLRLVPEMEGELGSVARVSFEAAASVRTVATRPELRIKQLAPAKVLIGQQLEVYIEISNPGTGAATGVELLAEIPEGLEHPKGRELTKKIGELQPGETKKIQLLLTATAPGALQNIVRLTSDEGLSAEDMVPVEVTAPQLSLELVGPSKRFLERQANFEVSIGNIGTAPASNVRIIAYLDRGLSFMGVGADSKGEYDQTSHAVFWQLAELQPGQAGSVPLQLLPVEMGSRVVRLEATADMGLKVEREKSVVVEGLAELTFSVADQHDPIEIGSETTYEVRVTNNGSRNDSNVRLQVELPPGMELISADPAIAGTSGRTIAFAPLAHLDSKGNTRIESKCAARVPARM